MAEYKTLNNLWIENGLLYCTRKSGRGKQTVATRQGSLDDACGPYALVMIMKILGVFNQEDLIKFQKTPEKCDKRTALNRFFAYLTKSNGWFNGGTYIYDLQALAPALININTFNYYENEDIIGWIADRIDKDIPVLLQVAYTKTQAHWVVIVGYKVEHHKKDDNIVELLLLDPGFDGSKIAVWNEIINLRDRNKTKYKKEINERYVDLTEAYAISKK
jgi:hypothetical protein